MIYTLLSSGVCPGVSWCVLSLQSIVNLEMFRSCKCFVTFNKFVCFCLALMAQDNTVHGINREGPRILFGTFSPRKNECFIFRGCLQLSVMRKLSN